MPKPKAARKGIDIKIAWGPKSVPKDMCAKHSRLSARKLFGIKYSKADAWLFGKANKVVWHAGNSKAPLEKALKPGRILCMWWPESRHNAPDREYTHTLLCLGRHKGEQIVLHAAEGKQYKLPLREVLKEYNGKIMAVVEPAKSKKQE